MYHHISEDVATDMVISPARFEAHMAALKEHGWNSVTIRQLIEFGEQGTPLPDHPVLITFDDAIPAIWSWPPPSWSAMA